MNFSKLIKHLLILIPVFLSSLLCSSQGEFNQIATSGTKSVITDNPGKRFALFEGDDLLEVTLRLDMGAYIRKDLSGDAKDGALTFCLGEADSLVLNVTLDNRGKFRLGNCSFPPMQINFKKQINAYSDSCKIKKIKLVTHCSPGNLYDEYVLKEFLVYRMFNIITDTSYRVRLLRINYIDNQNRRKPQTQYGFFIEPKSILAERTNSVIIETGKVTQEYIIPEVMDRVAIFNYMVSNWDWSLPGQHNVTVMKSRNISALELGIAVPYDFDLTGVVNANYAGVKPESSMKSVRDRLFLGVCRSEEVFRKELIIFLSKKEEIYSLITDFPYLKERSKRNLTGFLDLFFSQIERERSLDNLIKNFTRVCKEF